MLNTRLYQKMYAEQEQYKAYQIAQKAHTLNVIDVQRYDAAYHQFETAVKEITEAVVHPRPMGQ